MNAPVRSRLSLSERRTMIRYTRTPQWPMLQRFPVDEGLHTALLAQILACSTGTARAMVSEITREVDDAATALLTERPYRAMLETLPFGPDDRVVAVGDSITADRLGWFELLSASLAQLCAPVGAMVNLGLSGDTTADALERFDLLESARPSHVLLMLGTNDARSHGRGAGHRMVTAQETERNLRALLDLIGNELLAAVTVLTPPAVDQRRIDASFGDAPLRWRARDIAEIAEIVRRVVPSAVDLHSATRAHGVADLLEDDGVHPTPAGQRFLLRHIVAHLAAPVPGP